MMADQGIAIFVIGLCVGMVFAVLLQDIGARREARKRAEAAAAQPKPVCTCTHGRSMHEEGKGTCRVAEVRTHELTGREISRFVCPCQIYDGPVPLPSYYAQDIIGEG